MNLYRWPILLLIPTLIILTSCGSDSDSSDSATNEEQTTGTTGTTTGTTTGDSGNSCMTATQRNNIRAMFDRAALQSPFQGQAAEAIRNPDGTFTTEYFPNSTISIKKTSDNSWQSDGVFCVNPGETGCMSAQHVYSIAGTCYTEDGMTGKIKSSSPSKLSVSLTDTNSTPPLKQDSTYSFPSAGRARIGIVYTLNGLKNSTFGFQESGSTTGTTTTGATAASSTGSSTGSTTGETGTTTGGFSTAMGFGF